MVQKIVLAHGDPFLKPLQPPAPLNETLRRAQVDFEALIDTGGRGLEDFLNPESASIELAHAFRGLEDLLQYRLQQYLERDPETTRAELLDGSPDGWVVDLSSFFIELLQDNDEVTQDGKYFPIQVEVPGGKPICERRLLAALSIFQIDRCWTAFERGNIELFGLLLWDITEAFLEIALITTSQIIHEVEADSVQAFRNNGRTGGIKRHEGTRQLRQWAIEQARNMRGSDIEVARLLVVSCGNPRRYPAPTGVNG